MFHALTCYFYDSCQGNRIADQKVFSRAFNQGDAQNPALQADILSGCGAKG